MKLFDSLRTYLLTSKEELMTVSWPTRQDIMRYTGLVVVTVVVFGAFFSILDLGLNAGVQALIASRVPAATTNQPSAPTPVDIAPGTVDVTPVDVQATTPDGAPTEVKVEQVPVK